MKHICTWRKAVGVCLVLVGATSAFAQDWPQWRGAHGDAKVSGFVAPQTWPSELKKGWTSTLGSGVATPALVGNRLYAFTRQGDNEVIRCLDAGDGMEVWKHEYAAQKVTGAARRFGGPRSSPAVAAGKVVTLGVGGVLSCLDAASGELAWRKDPFPKVVPRFFAASSPLIVDGMAVAHLGGQGNGAIIAFDLASGDEKWRWGGEGPAYASIALLTVNGVRQVVTLGDQNVVGVRLTDGKLLWQVPFAAPRRSYNAATPIVDGQTVIYTGAGRGVRAVKIEKQGETFVPTELWHNADLAPQYNTPVIQGNLLFGLSDKGNLFCLNVETGKTAWTDSVQRDRRGYGSIVGTGSCLLALCGNSELVAFEPSDKGYAQLAQMKVSDTSTHAYPVVAGNRIFVKDQETVTLWTLQ